MSDEVKYRLLAAEDAERYHSLRLECLRNNPGNFGDSLEEELEVKTSRFKAELNQEKGVSFWYGAFSAGRLIGISGFIQQRRTKARHRGDLIQVYTSPGFANRGIGSALVKLTVEKAFSKPEIEQILLSAVQSNEKAIALYKKLGFVEYGSIENYFKKDGVYSSQLFMALWKNEAARLHQIQKENAYKQFALRLRLLFN